MIRVNRFIGTVGIVAILLLAGCSVEAPRADESQAIDPDEADGLFVFTNDQPSTALRVTVYVVEGPLQNYTYTLVNGSTVTRPDPVLGHTTHVRPATDLFWSHTFAVEAHSSLVVAFDDPPPSARLVQYHEPTSTAPHEVPRRAGWGQSPDMCLVSVVEPKHSRGGGGCGGFQSVVVENRTTHVSVDFGASNEPIVSELNYG